MNTQKHNPDELLEKIQSRLAIRNAREVITTEKQKQAMSKPTYQINPAKLWSRFKTGDTEHIFLTARAAKETIALAAREVNELSGGTPSAAENESRQETDWRLAREGKGRDFYSNGQAKDVLFIAAAEFNALKKAKADTAARSAAIAKAKAEAAAASAPPKASSAAAPELAGLTGLARATAIHKQKVVAHTPPPAAVAKPAKEAAAPNSTEPAPLHGLQKAIAATRGEKVSHDPPAELTGIAKAQAIHKADAAARK